jgi:hypothetical protein
MRSRLESAARRLPMLLPTLATAAVRVCQLLVLLALASCAKGAEQDILIVGFGLVGSFAMLTDSGAANYILSEGADAAQRGVVARATAFHVATTTAGLLLATMLTIAADPAAFIASWPVFAALAATQLLDSTSRIVRATHMAARRDVRYAVPDLALVAAKVPLLALAWISHSPVWLLLLPAASFVQVVIAWFDVRRFLPADGRPPKRLALRIGEFGVTGALSAFYTQVPLLAAATLWSPAVAAQISVTYRVVQAFDLLPSTAALQLIPRVRDQRARSGRYWFTFTGAGAAIAVLAIVAFPLINLVLGGVLRDPLLFATVAMAFAPRSGNYAIMAFAMGSGRIRDRFVATVITCCVAIALVAAVAAVGGPRWFGSSSLAIELSFSVLLAGLLARSRRGRDAQAPQPDHPRANRNSSPSPSSRLVTGR